MSQTLLERINHTGCDQPMLHLKDYALQEEITALTQKAVAGDDAACHNFHHLLAKLNRKRLSYRQCESLSQHAAIHHICTYMESQWVKGQQRQIAPLMQSMPQSPEGFIQWIELLLEHGPGQQHPLFLYLAERASYDEFRYFMQQELATEAGFDDMLSLTMVQTRHDVKMELAHNFWDEMGDGVFKEMHSEKLMCLVKRFDLSWDDALTGVHWAPLALSNLMIAFAIQRPYFYHSIGALGIIELTAPGRCFKVTEGLKRLGLSPEDYDYYSLHSYLDQEHWQGWKANAMRPLILENPDSMRAMAEGALCRLAAGERCFKMYSRHLGLDDYDSRSPLALSQVSSASQCGVSTHQPFSPEGKGLL